MSDKIRVTGGAGYIGRHASIGLAAAGYGPITYDSLGTSWRDAVQFGPFEQGDLRDRARLDAVRGRRDRLTIHGQDYLITLAFALTGARVLTQVRADLFCHLKALPLPLHPSARTGDLTVRLISDVGMLKETVVTAAVPLAVNALVLLGMVGVMLWLDWQLSLIPLAPLPLLWVVSLLRHLVI